MIVHHHLLLLMVVLEIKEGIHIKQVHLKYLIWVILGILILEWGEVLVLVL